MKKTLFLKTIYLSLILLLTSQLNAQYVVSITGKQPYPATDWDLVHGILGSRRLTDDLDQRVSDKLRELKHGNYNVTKIDIVSYKKGNYVYTTATAYINPSEDGKSYTVFTTRGSIGYKYTERHDEQVDGLALRLKNKYGKSVSVFGPYIVCVTDEWGRCLTRYKQSFFSVGS